MPRYRLTIAYDGTDFCGWQKQELLPAADAGPDAGPGKPADHKPPDQVSCHPPPRAETLARAEPLPVREGEDRPRLALRTVQHVVERALRTIVREEVVLIGASRTDAGVHARGQVAAFTTLGDGGASGGWPLDRGADRLLRALNGRLPEDIVVTACEPAPHDFNPIGDARSKGYSYTLHVAPPPPHGDGLRPLWDRRYVHHVWEPLDLDAMCAAAAHLVGEHDFASLAAAGHGRLTTVRTILSCDVREVEPVHGARRLRIEVAGTGFLWNMVRILSGTLVDVGRGRIRPGDIPAILAARDRTRAGPTLPPTGLCLDWIRYGH